MSSEGPDSLELDPRRWITLVIILTAVLIAVLDGSVLNVAIPTILHDFHTTLPSLQWVITGYSLTFAALLIIGGRLCDIYGARRLFMIGAGVFGVGSLIASLSTGVVMLVAGEAIIEGIGASLMLPATLGILTRTFQGRERATGFAAWGATMGAAVALGPLVGGFLTTNYSWRWAFTINVIIVPFAIAGAWLFTREVPLSDRRERIDVPGAALIASGMAFLVFGISEGGTYGWWRPLRTLTIGGWSAWPIDRPVSIVPIAFILSAVLLFSFYRVEHAKERTNRDPLFAFSQLRGLRFRYGLATLILLALGQTAFLLVISVFLQDGRHLTALDTGLWLVPSGVFIVVASQVGRRLTRTLGTTAVVRAGLAFMALGLLANALAINPTLTFAGLLPGIALFGTGIGFAASQLTNVVLADVPPEQSGSASGANTTVRMIGSSLGVSIISTMLSVLTVRYAVDAVQRSRGLARTVQTHAITQLHVAGVTFAPLAGTSAHDTSILERALGQAIASAARPPMFFATAVVALGFVTSFLIPRVGPHEDERLGTRDDALRRDADRAAAAVTIE